MGYLTNPDGAYPNAGLLLSGSTLYGTAAIGGKSAGGTVFKLKINGSGFRTLHSFSLNGSDPSTNSDGAKPNATLILSNHVLYGTAITGGKSGNGTVFAIKIDGSGFANLHNFSALSNSTNRDGAQPVGSLILSGSTLYGTAQAGGSSYNGTVFALKTDGTGFTTLHNFLGGSDGGQPPAGLGLSGNTLYGTTLGGSANNGTVFSVKTNGRDFVTLYRFTPTPYPGPYSNSDGASPFAGLILSGNTLYGTTVLGGSGGSGTIFAVNKDGTAFTTFFNFTPAPEPQFTNSDGASPWAGLILRSNTIYGTTISGGRFGSGTLFSLSVPPPQLTINRSGTNVILTWPTNVTGFTLQSSATIVSPAVWSSVFPGPVVVNGQNTVTNPISGDQKFYRLIQ